MRQHVGERQPSGPWRKIKSIGGARLKLLVVLQVIVKSKHELVVRRAGNYWQPEPAKATQHVIAEATKWRCRSGRHFLQSGILRITLRHDTERVGSDPNARLGRVDICEHA